jgi:uncharacterized protein YecE (DUF72 family)
LRGLGPLLIQLPPSLRFAGKTVHALFRLLRERFSGDAACEPRHRSWFSPEAEQLLQTARVAADPAVVPSAREPGGWPGLVYDRLHGSPTMYYSGYTREYLEALAVTLAESAPTAPTWCIFDNTALGAATANALEIMERQAMAKPAR